MFKAADNRKIEVIEELLSRYINFDEKDKKCQRALVQGLSRCNNEFEFNELNNMNFFSYFR